MSQSPPRLEPKMIRLPSADHIGSMLLEFPEVSGLRVPCCKSWIQMDKPRRTAALVPSGERLTSRYRSLSGLSASVLPWRSTHTSDILAGLPGAYTAVRVWDTASQPWHSGDRQFLVHGDALQIHVQQGSLDRFELPVHDHGLHAIAVERQVENRVVPALRFQDAQDLPRIDRDRSRFFARAVHHCGNLSARAHAPRGVLGAGFALLRFQYADIRCRRHNSVSVLL